MPELSQPPLGLAAVQRFYDPLKLVTFTVLCGSTAAPNRTFHITAHEKAAPNIRTFFEAAHLQGIGNLITSWDGCYNDRPKRLSNQLSMHGRGAAFDINASTNNQGDDSGDMPAALVELGRSLGFFWGGDFRDQYVDKMHFQLGVDFSLNGRAAPRVTYQEAGTPAPPETPELPKFVGTRAIKSFRRNDGQQLMSSTALITAEGHAYIGLTQASVMTGSVIEITQEEGVLIARVG